MANIPYTVEKQRLRQLIVVEAEAIIALMLEDIAREMGWEILGSVASEPDALQLVRSTTPSAAILDINVGRRASIAVAAALRERCIPVVFVAGYPDDEVKRLVGDDTLLMKVFSEEQLQAALKRIEPVAPR